MLPDEITQLIENTRNNERQITSLMELDAVLEPYLVMQFNVTQPEKESLLHYMRVNTPPTIGSFYDQHEKELVNILKYIQPPVLVNS